jgi:Ca2+-binding RTX toxin-like protein
VNFFPWSLNTGNTSFEGCTSGNNHTTSGDDVVLCATTGTAPAYLANGGSGNVLLIGNKGNDQLVGSATGETWIIGLAGTGHNVIQGNGGTGFIQERGDSNDTLIGTTNYTVAAN